MNFVSLILLSTVLIVGGLAYWSNRARAAYAHCQHEWHVTLCDGILRCKHCPACRTP